jgi:hypothetical protein
MPAGYVLVELTLLHVTAKAVQALTPDRRCHWVPISAMLQPDLSDFTEGLIKNFHLAEWLCRRL